jgi:DNA-binding NtrC family response regulator
VKNKTFREDLYHRLSVILIHVPTLNEREDDIPLLALHFMETVAENQGKAPALFMDEALEELKKIQYTGNIRELRNIIERLAILCGPVISAEDVKYYAQPFRG